MAAKSPRNLAPRVAFLFVIGLATLTPLVFDLHVWARLASAFRFSYSARDAVDLVRNVALFAGWGALWAVTAHGHAPAHRIWHATGSGFVVSAFVEVVQLFMPERNASVVDLMSNTVGSAVGALAIVAVVVVLTAQRNAKSYVGIPAHLFAVSYGVAVAIDMMFPLLRSEQFHDVSGGPLSRLAVAVDRFDPASVTNLPGLDAVLYLPLGVLVVMALAESGWRHDRAAQAVAAGGVIAAVGFEVLHGALGIPIELGPMVTHAMAIALGGVVGALGLARFSRRFRGRRDC